MKQALLVCALFVALSGCAFLESQKANWDACKQDPGCFEKAKHYQDIAETVTVPIASAVPVPGAAAAPNVIGFIAFAVSMLLGGRAVRKRKIADLSKITTITTP